MSGSKNLLIATLPSRDRASLLGLCQSVPLTVGAILSRPGQPIRHVYFPDDGFISLAAQEEGEHALEVGLVGREGMLGMQLSLGIAAVPLHAKVRGEGTAQRMEVASFRHELARSESLQRQVHRYVYVLVDQLAGGAACTRFHGIAPRLARWLLMSHDRALSSGCIQLTHEALAAMLGVRRAGITRAAGELQRQGLVRYHRGEITVLDRSALMLAACGCYSADLRAYRRVFG
jgi:CRP-like cAMP-binding protein